MLATDTDGSKTLTFTNKEVAIGKTSADSEIVYAINDNVASSGSGGDDRGWYRLNVDKAVTPCRLVRLSS